MSQRSTSTASTLAQSSERTQNSTQVSPLKSRSVMFLRIPTLVQAVGQGI